MAKPRTKKSSRLKGGRSSSAPRNSLAVVNKTPQKKSPKRNGQSAQQSRPALRLIPQILDRAPLLAGAFGPRLAFAVVVLAIFVATGSTGFIAVTAINALRH
jgi:hypothetical protein